MNGFDDFDTQIGCEEIYDWLNVCYESEIEEDQELDFGYEIAERWQE